MKKINERQTKRYSKSLLQFYQETALNTQPQFFVSNSTAKVCYLPAMVRASRFMGAEASLITQSHDVTSTPVSLRLTNESK